MVGASILECRVRGVSPHRAQQLFSRVGRRYRQRVLQLCDEVLPGRPEGVLVQRGDPRAVIPAAARRLRADLVVLGGSSGPGFGGVVLGSVARAVIDRVTCDVLTVRGSYPW
jgi:nucleotide-binding universal stress UspA family protein